MGQSLASPQKHWYEANFRSTEPVETLSTGYPATHIGPYNAKPNTTPDSAAYSQSKPDEYY